MVTLILISWILWSNSLEYLISKLDYVSEWRFWKAIVDLTRVYLIISLVLRRAATVLLIDLVHLL